VGGSFLCEGVRSSQLDRVDAGRGGFILSDGCLGYYIILHPLSRRMHLAPSASSRPRNVLAPELSGTDRAQTDTTWLIITHTLSEPTSEPFCPGWPSAGKPPHRPVWRCRSSWADWTACAEIRPPRTPRTPDALDRLPKNSDRVGARTGLDWIETRLDGSPKPCTDGWEGPKKRSSGAESGS
jgi:hypothetical protein